MPPGEIRVTCPHCGHSTSLPIAAVKRNNYYCGKCFEKIPMQDLRAYDSSDGSGPGSRSKRNARGYRR